MTLESPLALCLCALAQRGFLLAARKTEARCCDKSTASPALRGPGLPWPAPPPSPRHEAGQLFWPCAVQKQQLSKEESDACLLDRLATQIMPVSGALSPATAGPQGVRSPSPCEATPMPPSVAALVCARCSCPAFPSPLAYGEGPALRRRCRYTSCAGQNPPKDNYTESFAEGVVVGW